MNKFNQYKQQYHISNNFFIDEKNGINTLKSILELVYYLNKKERKKINDFDYYKIFSEINDYFFINSLYPYGKNFIVSYRTKSKRKAFHYIEDFYPYFFVKQNKIHTFIEPIENKYVVSYEHPGYTKKIRSLLENKYSFFEADILYDIRFYVNIMSLFRNKINSGINFRIWYADIEVYSYNINKRFDYSSDENFINAINIFDNYDNTLYSLFVHKERVGKIETKINIDNKVFKQEIIYCKSEKELLLNFFELFITKLPDFITFWNAPFDTLYIYHKSLKYLNNIFEIWGLFENINTKKDEEKIFFYDSDFMGDRDIVHILTSTTLDLLFLYQKSVLETREEYSLDYISKVELGEKTSKVKYEGTLEELYDNNFDKFLEYSSVDALLLYLIDSKLELINKFIILSDISYLPIRYFNKDFTSKVNDCIYLQHLIPRNEVFLSKQQYEKEKYVGAHVHLPIPGIYGWFIDLDASSMYPSIIISANVSPDTFLYAFKDIYKKVKENNEIKLAVDNNMVEKIRKYLIENIDEDNISEKEFTLIDKYKQFIKKKLKDVKKELKEKYNENFIFTPSGAIFRSDIKGIMPMIMEKLIDYRKHFKMMKKFAPN